jgi:hypothetical protein
LSIFKEHTVTGDIFLAILENILLRHVPVGAVFQLEGAPPHFFHCIRTFLDREFLDRWMGRQEPIVIISPLNCHNQLNSVIWEEG